MPMSFVVDFHYYHCFRFLESRILPISAKLRIKNSKTCTLNQALKTVNTNQYLLNGLTFLQYKALGVFLVFRKDFQLSVSFLHTAASLFVLIGQ